MFIFHFWKEYTIDLSGLTHMDQTAASALVEWIKEVENSRIVLQNLQGNKQTIWNIRTLINSWTIAFILDQPRKMLESFDINDIKAVSEA